MESLPNRRALVQRVGSVGISFVLGSGASMTTQGSNSTRLRRFNERAVLNAVRGGGEMSKADIARATKLTPPAVSAIVNTLAAADYLGVKAVRTGSVGSPSELYGLQQRGAFSLGLHIGRRAMNSVLIDF